MPEKECPREPWLRVLDYLGKRHWSAQEIAELLWMAQRIAADAPEPDPSLDSPKYLLDKSAQLGSVDLGQQEAQQLTGSRSPSALLNSAIEDDPSLTKPTPERKVPLMPAFGPESSSHDSLSVGVADPGLLPHTRRFRRALSPLNRWVQQGPRCQLDVAATVEQIARARIENGPWQPVLTARRQAWLSLDLLFDSTPSMALWQRLRRELPRRLGKDVRWRDLRCWQLGLDATGKPLLKTINGRPRSPRLLRQRTERSLLLLVSDGVHEIWYDGSLAKLLQNWAAAQPLALLQVLPQRMWLRTVLAQRQAGWVRARRSVQPNPQLGWIPVDNWEIATAEQRAAQAKGCLTLPLMELEPIALGAWANLICGARGGSALAYRFPLPTPELKGTASLPTQSDGPAATSEALGPDEVEDLLAVFLFTASRKARRLLALLTFAPVITLPVVRLVQHLLVPGSGPAEQAEVLLSGLFKNLSIPNQPAAANAKQEQTLVPIDRQLLQLVDEDLRLRLRDGLRVWEARQVFDAVKEQVAKSLNRSTDKFEALLRNPRDSNGENFEALLAAFATVAPSCLRGLGQSYEDLANDIEAGWSSAGTNQDFPEPWPKQHFTFEDLPYETAKLLPIPPSDLISFSTACYQEMELLPISFETGKLTITSKPEDRTKKKSNQKPVIEIHRSIGSAQAFYEPLQRKNLPPGAIAEAADPLTLTLVEIPQGEFPMGSPPEEPERYDDEGPQHLVKLESFFMAQTPITQAQWREVAGWQPWDGESWGRELKPNPSHFRGGDNQKGGKARLFDGEANTDQRPVEQVNWEDAIEFCNRLSQRTGRHYSLPSEAQWEYACRAGSITPFHFGETLSSELANFDGTEVYAGGLKGDWRRQTTPVGKSLASITSADAFPANDWGLQDMHGNVWEWCLDQWHPSYEGAPVDGSAWVDADANQANIKKDEEFNDKLLRGGSWIDHPGYCRSASRFHHLPDLVSNLVGLRVVCLPQGCSS